MTVYLNSNAKSRILFSVDTKGNPTGPNSNMSRNVIPAGATGWTWSGTKLGIKDTLITQLSYFERALAATLELNADNALELVQHTNNRIYEKM